MLRVERWLDLPKPARDRASYEIASGKKRGHDTSKPAHDVKMYLVRFILAENLHLGITLEGTDATGTAGECHRLSSLSDELKRAKHLTNNKRGNHAIHYT